MALIAHRFNSTPLIAPLFLPHSIISIPSWCHSLWHLIPQSVTFSSNLAPQPVIIPSWRHFRLNDPFLLSIHFPHRFTSHTGRPPSKCSLVHPAMSSEKKEFDDKLFKKPADEGRTDGEIAEIAEVSPATAPRVSASFMPR